MENQTPHLPQNLIFVWYFREEPFVVLALRVATLHETREPSKKVCHLLVGIVEVENKLKPFHDYCENTCDVMVWSRRYKWKTCKLK
jgi:hypothetical protein